MTRVKLFTVLLSLVLLLCACASDSDAVATVGGEEVSYDLYRYFYKNYQKESESYTEAQIKEKSFKAIASDVALSKLADKYELELTSDDEDAISEYVDTAIANYGGEEAYKKALEENFLTEELFEYFYSQQVLESRLRDYMYDEMNNVIRSDDATFEKDLYENFMAAKQIFIRNDEGDDIEKNRELADSVFAKAINGEDFDSLITEYSEDSSANDNYVYHFTHGQMLLAFEEAVEKTEVGQICSHVAVSEAGYHIIMRLELDEEYIDSHFEELRDAFKARRFNEIRQELAESLAWEESEGFEELDFDE